MVGTLILAFCAMPPCAFVVCIQPWVKVKMLRTYSGSARFSNPVNGYVWSEKGIGRCGQRFMTQTFQ